VSHEAELLLTLDHQHIINIYHYWIDEEKSRLVFITELMTSGTLKEYLKAKKVKLEVSAHTHAPDRTP
jgi:serine/threonine protein kinase